MRAKRKRTPLTPEEQLYVKHLIKKHDRLIRWTISKALNPDFSDEYDDVIQNIYEAICDQLEDFKTCQSQQALIITITRRTVWRLHSEKRTLQNMFVPLTDDYPAPEEDRGLGEILPASTSSLDRQVLTAVYERRDTEREVAEDMGKKPAAIRQQVKRARDRFKNSLKFF